ncbi:dCMP deaminase [Pyrococcus furiosus DSM 3638]|uniref:dCMP deaminase n=3 Tax=Pyrococcus furiosus TaxID=2261 RepID=A0A5C0XR68_PYRFU|nr:cytidine/deoxycytidylate deaminase family protein [Pyrococcus furiosus]AAL81722.1 dCMP deaminase [Pyrococcus furiosus DSM 3638]AFN04380.1 dCMP deaminase [Pyrococcus furiosus COM1]QEK79221.1 dCMP deaminase [Pyrococcus furiosus DSM 3638]
MSIEIFLDKEKAEKIKKIRPTKDEYFMLIAKLVSLRATCPRLRVGAVAVKDGYILATGYNGAPRSMDHCIDKGCILVNGHCHRAVHAEQNVIAMAARKGISLEGATLYVTHFPCDTCFKLLINAGIKEIVYEEMYPNEVTEMLLKEAQEKGLIKIRQFKLPKERVLQFLEELFPEFCGCKNEEKD